MDEYRGVSELADPLSKKRLQAAYLVKGFGSPWQELIDIELPGPALTEDDIDIISEVALQTIAEDDVHAKQYEARYDEMESYIMLNGVEQIGEREQIALAQLVLLSLVKMEGVALARRIEDARAVIFKLGLSDPAWLGLLDKYFNVSEP
jgi:hypothetical protein